MSYIAKFQIIKEHRILSIILVICILQKTIQGGKIIFLQSLRIRKEIKDYKGVAQTNYDLAIAEAENHNITQAITYLQSAWNEKRVDLSHEMRRNCAKALRIIRKKIEF